MAYYGEYLPIDVDYVNEKYTFIPETGELVFKSSGRVKGTTPASGEMYSSVIIRGSKYKVHRIIWALHYKVDPGEYQVDHINRDRFDNRIDNLRLTNAHGNGHNRRMNKLRRNTKGEYYCNIHSVKNGKRTLKRTRRSTCPIAAKLYYINERDALIMGHTP